MSLVELNKFIIFIKENMQISNKIIAYQDFISTYPKDFLINENNFKKMDQKTLEEIQSKTYSSYATIFIDIMITLSEIIHKNIHRLIKPRLKEILKKHLIGFRELSSMIVSVYNTDLGQFVTNNSDKRYKIKDFNNLINDLNGNNIIYDLHNPIKQVRLNISCEFSKR